MFGILRLLLAALVAASHCGLNLAGLNPGVSAVVVFYLLAGYIMHDQLVHHYRGPTGTRLFYLDRALRIFPVYLLFLALALAFVLLTGYRSAFMHAVPSPWALLQNALIVPLNFYMYTDIEGCMLIPPAWSLGAELQFYLLAPLLVRHRPAFVTAFGLSALVFLLAAAGHLHTDHFGYRLLPGVLFIFLTGAALATTHPAMKPAPRPGEEVGWISAAQSTTPHNVGWISAAQSTNPRPPFWKAAWRLLNMPRLNALRAALPALLTGLAALALAWGRGNLSAPFLREVLIGLFIGIALILLLQRLPRTPWDVRLGYLAYGLFLAHFLPIGWFELHPGPAPGSAAHIAAVLLIALALAVLAYLLVDRPMARVRKALRHRLHVAHAPHAAEMIAHRKDSARP